MIINKKLIHKLVIVNWDDIVVSLGWIDKDRIHDEAGKIENINTVGWLSAIKKDSVIISSTLGKNGPDQYNQHIAIPIGCIRSLKKY
jgi:hypothetical protein